MEIHESIMETLGKESHSFSTVLNLGEGGIPLKMMKGLGTIWSYVTGGETCENSQRRGPMFRAVQSILTDSLGMSKISARWVPRIFTEDQKRSWLDISMSLLSRYKDDPEKFVDLIVTQDANWVHHFDRILKSKACSGSTLAHPLLRNLREFLEQGR